MSYQQYDGKGSWMPIDTCPENTEVETCIHDTGGFRQIATLVKKGNLFWSGDMYVYYAPTHWRFSEWTVWS